jgi:hypothetical protein
LNLIPKAFRPGDKLLFQCEHFVCLGARLFPVTRENAESTTSTHTYRLQIVKERGSL